MKETKNNKLIAEFMGWTLFASRESKPPQEMAIHEALYNETYNKGQYFDITEACYDISWDWLMSVVEKIYDTDIGEEQIKVYDSLAEINISNTYKVVVEFIEYYNEKNK